MELLRDHSVFHTAVAMPAYKVLSHHKHRPSDGKPNARTVRVVGKQRPDRYRGSQAGWT